MKIISTIIGGLLWCFSSDFRAQAREKQEAGARNAQANLKPASETTSKVTGDQLPNNYD